MGHKLIMVPKLFSLGKIGAIESCIHSHHRQTLMLKQLAHCRALDISPNNINTATHTERESAKEKESCDKAQKKSLKE